ncbi:MAG: chorismate-binding protein [Bacteroidetes bacterium]|nr:chorismate-binding protein [Bacteroidota bacterium]
MPDESHVVTWIQRSGHFQLVEHIDEVIDQPGFVYAPFHRLTNFPVVFFEPEIIVYNEEFENELIKEIKEQGPLYADFDIPTPLVVSKEEYLIQAAQFTGSFNHIFPKAVLSRVDLIQKKADFDVGDFFRKLHHAYPKAFCHVIHIPGAGTWAGATPETLFRSDGQTAKTVSLAGTLPLKTFDEEFSWKEKELEEQQWVTQYIEDVFANFGIKNYEVAPIKSITAGDIVHLATEFQFPVRLIKNNLGAFLKTLHPSPAICGFPKARALDLILKTEKHNREYYAGFCGPINYLDKTDLFVNLRCMKILPESLALFVGGGLTAKSDPEKEWEETVLKSKTLMKLL